ncbi:odorant receptor 30a-like [Fopius arisanus]|uniref:Odorant receptor 30a-like n=1 Tax=Fopius arisanus TaxID=64838 RepID=A0A9R1U732_9HYME|nr:PREDICTED: odorant receptor 30a-like [Fopius arisanus]
MAELVDSTFTNMYALLVVLNTVLISVTGLETILMMDQPSEMARFFLCAISFAAHLMILSVPSQEILDHSSQLSEAIYASNWMEMSIKDRQLISIMLMRSRKPLCLTAGRFYHIHVENFSQVLKKSFSYFTVLISSR